MTRPRYFEGYTFRDNQIVVPLFLLVFALILRQYAAAVSNVIAPDGITYINTAKMINSGDFRKVSEYSFFSLYPFMIVLSQKIFVNWEMAGRMVSVILGSMAVVPLFFLVRNMIDTKTAIIASIFYAISPRLVEYSSDVLRESTFWFFSISALWLGWEGIARKNWLYLTLSSFFVGLSIFTRMEGISIFFIVVLWSFYFFLKKNFGIKGLLYRLLVFLIALPIIFSPSLYLLKSRLGRWEFGLAGFKVPQLLANDNEEILKNEAGTSDKTSLRFKSFLDIANRHKYLSFFSEVIYSFIKSFNVCFFLLLLFGLFKRRTIPYSEKEIPTLIWFIVFFLTSYLYVAKAYYFSTRHGLLMGIPALVWAGIGFRELGSRIELWVKKMWPAPAMRSPRLAIILLLLIVFAAILPKTLSSSGTDKVELKEAGLYLKKMNYADAKFVGDPALHRVAFYADARFIALPSGLKFEELVNFLKKNHAEYLMVDRRSIDALSVDFKANLNSAFLEKVPLPRLETYKEYSITVYKVKG